MKKKALIKKIASEFNIDEIKVLEYFDNIFETLAVTFAKNKNVNISEFGKFNVKAKLDEEGKKQRTVLFSPVKKFAYDVNHNFNELLPVQIRILDNKGISGVVIEDEYFEDEIEEIIFIDFEDAKTSEVKKILKEDIPEKIKEEVLIPEETAQEILQEEIIPKEEAEKVKEEVLIPEETAQEISCETITEEVKEEIVSEIIPVITETETVEHIEPSIESLEIEKERNRLLDELDKIVISEISFLDFIEKVKLAETISRSKKLITEVTTIIKPEAIKEEIKEPEEVIKEKEIKEEEIIIPETPVTEEGKEEEIISIKEEIVDEVTPVLKVDEDNKEQDTKKTSLELEVELLKMLDERKKILEEIKNLENTEPDELVDISKSNVILTDEKAKLFEESTDDGNSLEDLLNKMIGSENLSSEPIKEEEIIPETTEEEIISEETEKHIKEDIELKEITGEKTLTPDNEINELEDLLGSLYEEKTKETSFPEPKEVEPHLNNLEMNIFDKLLDEPIKPPVKEIPPPVENPNEDEIGKDIMSLSELENMFKEFKTENSESQIEKEKPVDIVPQDYDKIDEVVKKDKLSVKTGAIKTYDDIFNLIEPNGKKKEEKTVEIVKEEPKKKISPIVRILILIGIVILIFFVSTFLYEKLVYKSSEENTQRQITLLTDSTSAANNDSIIYADTNKIKESIEEDIVYDENDVVIKESENGFFIEFGTFENQFELAKKIKELKDKKIRPGYEEVTIEGRQVYKMKLGPYKSLKAAKSIIPKL
jgi:nucleoid DNA-binding protein